MRLLHAGDAGDGIGDIVARLGDVPEARIREELVGNNLCRCTGYVGIVAAIRAVCAGRLPAAAPTQAARSSATVTLVPQQAAPPEPCDCTATAGRRATGSTAARRGARRPQR